MSNRPKSRHFLLALTIITLFLELSFDANGLAIGAPEAQVEDRCQLEVVG